MALNTLNNFRVVIFAAAFCTVINVLYGQPVDTLTNRQVYNFNVGDTLDYYITSANPDLPTFSAYYKRRVVTSKTLNANQDTLSFSFFLPRTSSTETLAITDLDSLAIFTDTLIYSSCLKTFTFNDSIFGTYLSDSLNIGCFESGATYRYTKTLGRTFYGTAAIALNSNGCICQNEALIYYSNGVTAVGNPYYVTGKSNLIKYLPLPEECAVWTVEATGSCLCCGSTYPPPLTTIISQLSSGNKLIARNRTYVQLFLRTYNTYTSEYRPDSLIGYYYNDTIVRAAYFVTDTNAFPQLIYSFNLLQNESCNNDGVITIDSILIDGTYRTYWRCNNYSYNGSCTAGTIAGIGWLGGLVPLHECVYNTSGEVCPSLTCFSLCGRALYPDTNAACPRITAIPLLENAGLNIELSPNPTSDFCIISSNIPGNVLSASLYDISGRELLKIFEKQQIGRYVFDVQSLPAGIYLVQIKDQIGSTKIQKLIKQ